MKKLYTFLLALVTIMALAGCVSNEPPEISAAPTTTAATIPTTAPEPQPPAGLQSGYYLLERMMGIDTSNEEYADIIKNMKMYIQINADHTAIISVMGVSTEAEWNDTNLIADNSSIEYVLEGELLTIAPGTEEEFTFRYNGDILPEHYLTSKLTSGYFVLSSVGENGDISFFYTLSPENGYVKLNEDMTGVMYYNGMETPLVWDNLYLYVGDDVYPYVYYSIEETGDGQSMLMVYMLETQTSLVLRPMDEPAE